MEVIAGKPTSAKPYLRGKMISRRSKKNRNGDEHGWMSWCG